MNKIEIDNLDEVLKAMGETPKQPHGEAAFKVQAIPMDDPNAPSLKQMLQTLADEAEEWENIIVIRFNVTNDPEKGCHTNGDTRVAVRGPHAAIHGIALMEEILAALKQKIVETFIDGLPDNFFNRKTKSE